jgi:MEMO1 family protein
MDYPKLRTIDIFPVEHEGQQYYCLIDPQKISGAQMTISVVACYLLRFFDGEHTVEDIQYEYASAFGELLVANQLNDLIEELDSALFLDNERFQQKLGALQEEFKLSAIRKAFLAGLSYSDDRAELVKELDRSFEGVMEDVEASLPAGDEEIAGIIAPHIDFARGEVCYASAYEQLKRAISSDPGEKTFVVLGICHQQMKNYYSVCSKSFATPLGDIEIDTEFVEELGQRCEFDIFEDEFYHRAEHSVEFQAVMLKYVAGDASDIKIVPILCGSFHKFVQSDTDPADGPQVAGFIQALKDVIAGSARRIYIVGGVDLAHFGQKFGDPNTMDPLTIESVKEADGKILDAMEKMDAARFFRLIRSEKDRWKVCGWPAIYTMLNVIDADRAKVIKYDQDVDRATESLVSFAAAAFTRKIR